MLMFSLGLDVILQTVWITFIICNVEIHTFLNMFIYCSSYSTFVCPTEIISFSDRAEEFRALNCEVLACSVDSHFSHLAWYETWSI